MVFNRSLMVFGVDFLWFLKAKNGKKKDQKNKTTKTKKTTPTKTKEPNKTKQTKNKTKQNQKTQEKKKTATKRPFTPQATSRLEVASAQLPEQKVAVSMVFFVGWSGGRRWGVVFFVLKKMLFFGSFFW